MKVETKGGVILSELPQNELTLWLRGVLPELPQNEFAVWLRGVLVITTAQILLAACRRFPTVRTCDSGSGWK